MSKTEASYFSIVDAALGFSLLISEIEKLCLNNLKLSKLLNDIQLLLPNNRCYDKNLYHCIQITTMRVKPVLILLKDDPNYKAAIQVLHEILEEFYFTVKDQKAA